MVRSGARKASPERLGAFLGKAERLGSTKSKRRANGSSASSWWVAMHHAHEAYLNTHLSLTEEKAFSAARRAAKRDPQ